MEDLNKHAARSNCSVCAQCDSFVYETHCASVHVWCSFYVVCVHVCINY